jgi:hypothetical protein
MSADDEKTEPEFFYKLVVTAAGPNYFGRIEVESESLDELQPEFVELNGVTYERYGDEDDYAELRFDYVVKRERSKVEQVEKSSADQDKDIAEAMSSPGEPPPHMQAPRAPSPREAREP